MEDEASFGGGLRYKRMIRHNFIGKTRREEGGKMVLVELITASGSMMTAWVEVLIEFIKLPVEILSTIFNVVTG